ncbi:MAG: Trk system potassium transporter TrkA [Candidatus Zixiibacteriota bacterium]|nr:MAG: Trk system potassium transporter TrkA [candidate division Zixibacteria bacterium]
MKIIIIGAGRIGTNLAGELAREKHSVVVIDSDPERLERISQSMDVLAMEGDGTRQKLLREAGIASADMVIAVTSSDEGNILACMIAREYKVRTKIARVRDHELSAPDSVLAPERIGIDLMIHPELEAAREIIRLILHPSAFDVMEFFDGKVEILGVRLTRESPAVGKTLQELGSQMKALPYRVVAIARGDQTLIPKGDQDLQADDLVYVITQRAAAYEVFNLTSRLIKVTNNLMIYGASRVGLLVAQGLEEVRHFNAKLVDPNPLYTRQAAQRLRETLVVEADGLDLDALAAEGLIDMDAYIACSDDDENNIVTSLVARHLGVPRTITLVDRRHYMPIIRTIGLDVAVNKHVLTSNAILKYIRRGNILSFSQIRGIDAEAVVYSVVPKARITRRPLKDLDLPRDALLGALRRNGDIHIPTGDTQVKAGDEVMVFSLPGARRKIDSWFD